MDTRGLLASYPTSAKAPGLAALVGEPPRQGKEIGETYPSPPSYRAPWTPADDDRLLNWAGYEPVKKIAQRLGRSDRAVRFRLGALGISAKVTDGWSLRALRKMLRVSPSPTEVSNRKRHVESARSAHICKLSGSVLRQNSCIF